MKSKQKSRGQVLILITIAMVALLAMLGLVIDGGMLLAERRRAQNAVDGAALAAATDIVLQRSNQAVASALDYARRNGYNNDGVTNKVTVNIPPISGQWTGNINYAQVSISKNSRVGFVFSKGNVAASAVAGGERWNGDAAILTLNRSASKALRLDGDGTTTVINGGVMDNSSATDALFLNGNSQIHADSIGISGNYSATSGSQFSPAPRTGVLPIDDPLRSVPPPSLAGLPVRGAIFDTSAGDTTLQPGVYEGGITVQGKGSVVMMPGVYVMKGGGLHVSGNGSVEGNGILVYNTSDRAGRFGDVSVTGNGVVNLDPAQSGIYQGLTFFQDRAATVPASFAGNALVTGLSGTIYFPSAAVEISGEGTMNGAQLIADTLKISGNGNLTIAYDKTRVYPAILPYLVQ